MHARFPRRNTLAALGVAVVVGSLARDAAAQAVRLVVAADTGESLIAGIDDTVDITGYSIISLPEPGQLLPDNWVQLSGLYPQFFNAGPADVTFLSEITLGDPAPIPTSGISLGNLFDTSFLDASNLAFSYLRPGELDEETGPVDFVSSIPEPATASLLVLGGGLLLARRRR